MSKSIVPLGSILVDDVPINVLLVNQKEFVSLTDMIVQHSEDTIKNWIRNKNTIEFLGVWESLNNPNFNQVEFDRLRNEAGTNRFLLSAGKRVELTNAIGLSTKKGRYGAGTFAHKDIAFEFASWISPVFKLYVMKAFHNFMNEPETKHKLEWQTERILTKVNHYIHTDTIKDILLVPQQLPHYDASKVYANNVDMLNVALFGITAKDWKKQHSDKEGNMRDYASIPQLVILSNLENLNAELIKMGLPPEQRFEILRTSALDQNASMERHHLM